MSILLSPAAPDGFAVTSFANDDWRDCRDHVRQILGLQRDASAPTRQRATLNVSSSDRLRIAARLWEEAEPIRMTAAETYLINRGLELHTEAYDADTLRFHRSCPFRLADGSVLRLPTLLAKMVDIQTSQFRGVHRTALAPDGFGKSRCIWPWQSEEDAGQRRRGLRKAFTRLRGVVRVAHCRRYRNRPRMHRDGVPSNLGSFICLRGGELPADVRCGGAHDICRP